MEGATESRNGKILLSIIENTPYTDQPQSRIEELLIELKEIIEAGGGGGTTSYEGLTGKPKINGYTLLGDVSLSDIGAASEDDLSEKQDTISDLSTIRRGAAAGATAVQPADMNTALAAKQDTLTFDSTPTQDSSNPVTSGGIWTDQQRQDTLQDEDRAALVELVDGGAKNKFTNASYSVSSTGSWSETSGLTNIIAGVKYIMSFENLESSDTDSTTIQIRFSNSDSTYQFYRQCQRGQNVTVSFTPEQDITNVRIYKADSFAHGDGDTMSFSGAMICTETDWKISQTFQSCRPSWQEMYEMILQLQTAAGLKSTLSLRSAAAPLENEDDLQKDEIQIETEVKE